MLIGHLVDYSRYLQRGDHIAIKGIEVSVEYYHHGIYLGENKVVHTGATSKGDAVPRNTDMQMFLKHRENLLRINYPAEECLPPDRVAETAKFISKNPKLWGPMRLFTNNCEHFATYCKTGTGVSLQVDNFVPPLSDTIRFIKWAIILLIFIVYSVLNGSLRVPFFTEFFQMCAKTFRTSKSMSPIEDTCLCLLCCKHRCENNENEIVRHMSTVHSG